MYENPIILSLPGDDPDFCANPVTFDFCDVYCVMNSYCVYLTVYKLICDEPQVNNCLPDNVFNDCTYYGCSVFQCPGAWT